MGKFDGILFCTDLDGTLYRNDKTVSKENLDAIEYFKMEGGCFTFITGRVPVTATAICEIIKPNVPYGCINGGGIYDFVENRYLWKETLPQDVKELICSVRDELPEIGIQVNTEKQVYFIRDNAAMVHFRSVTGLPNVSKELEDIDDPMLKIIFAHHEEEQICKVQKLLNSHPKADKFDFIRSEHSLYEILPKGVSKGNLVLKLAELLGINENRTIAVGDYDNDVSMVKSAGIGYAVSNARDSVKEVADRITVSNEENAIAAIIEELDSGTLII